MPRGLPRASVAGMNDRSGLGRLSKRTSMNPFGLLAGRTGISVELSRVRYINTKPLLSSFGTHARSLRTRVWMAPEHARGSLWATAINGLIHHRYRCGYTALLLNTWPADYKADRIDVHGW